MAENLDRKGKQKANPLAGISRKPSSYVGDLDSLMAEVGDGQNDAERSLERTEPLPVPTEPPQKPAAERSDHVVTKRMNLDVPEDLHKRFKGVTGMQGLTMTEVMQQLMVDYVDRAMRDL